MVQRTFIARHGVKKRHHLKGSAWTAVGTQAWGREKRAFGRASLLSRAAEEGEKLVCSDRVVLQ